MTLEIETKEYHRKKLYELSIKSLGEIPQLEEPSYDQKAWVVRRMRDSKKSWEVWDS
jgi:hypothetical protein